MIPVNGRKLPQASVILPVFNGEPYLVEAIRSVLDQSFTNFECLLLNDGSTDGSLAILEHFAVSDSRCKVYSWSNKGLIETLNRGLDLASASLIFRMDQDDICKRERFEKQIAYLNAHPECVAVGSRVLLIDDTGLAICEFNDILEHEDIDAAHLSGTAAVICHPTVAMRKDAVIRVGGYRREIGHASEDFDLFLRLAEVGRLANMPEVLLSYRQHLSSIGYRIGAQQRRAGLAVVAQARRRRGMAIEVRTENTLPLAEQVSLSAQHRIWAWWALGAGNLQTARKHTWKALVADPFDPANLRLITCVLRGY